MSLLDAFLEEDILEAVMPQAAKEVWIAIRTDLVDQQLAGTQIGDGSRENPYSGATPKLFDDLMAALPANTIVHLGPGVFHTRGGPGFGYILQAEGFSPRSGQRIIGTGMFATTLRFYWDHPITNGERHNIISVPHLASTDSDHFLSDFQLSDLTLDCALRDFEFTNLISCCGVLLTGDHLVVRRVRVIDFGTRTPFLINGAPSSSANTLEAFPMRVGGRYTIREDLQPSKEYQTFNPVIEDCLIEQPYTGCAREVTFILPSSVNPEIDETRFTPSGEREHLHVQPVGQVVRDNYFNFYYVNPRAGNPVPIQTLIYSDPVATLTAQFPHNLRAGDYVELTLGSALWTRSRGRNLRVPVVRCRALSPPSMEALEGEMDSSVWH